MLQGGSTLCKLELQPPSGIRKTRLLELPQEAFDSGAPMIPVQLWKLQEACLILFQRRGTKFHELVWLRLHSSHQDPSHWAINHNSPQEDPRLFQEPPFLKGDPTLSSVLLACTPSSGLANESSAIPSGC